MTRTLLSVIVWLLCTPALVGLGVIGMAFLNYSGRGEPVEGWAGALPALLALASGYFAWFCLFWMNLHWVRNQPLHPGWPLIGTAAAVAALLPFGAGAVGAALFAVPGIVFACFLVGWHLLRRRQPGPA